MSSRAGFFPSTAKSIYHLSASLAIESRVYIATVALKKSRISARKKILFAAKHDYFSAGREREGESLIGFVAKRGSNLSVEISGKTSMRKEEETWPFSECTLEN